MRLAGYSYESKIKRLESSLATYRLLLEERQNVGPKHREAVVPTRLLKRQEGVILRALQESIFCRKMEELRKLSFEEASEYMLRVDTLNFEEASEDMFNLDNHPVFRRKLKELRESN